MLMGHSVNLGDLLLGAQGVMQASGLTNIKKSTVDVSGRTPNGHAFITFLKTPDDWVAFTVAAGVDAKVVCDKLSDALGKLVHA